MLNKSRHPVNALSGDTAKIFLPELRLEKSGSKGEQTAQEILSLHAGRTVCAHEGILTCEVNLQPA